MDTSLRPGKSQETKAQGFAPERAAPDSAIEQRSATLANARFVSVVAERDGRIVGVRLVQAGLHNRSLSRYTELGYVVREALACIQGPALGIVPHGLVIRAVVEDDIEACNRLCRRVHGHHRDGELREAVAQGTAALVERGGRVTGYATAIGFHGHAVGDTNKDLQALIGAAGAFAGYGFLVPTRNTGLLRWCLEQGLRVVQPLTLLSRGAYHEPAGAFLPSILY